MGSAEAYLRGPLRRSLLVRRIAEDPTSRLAVWARRFALFAVVVIVLGIGIVRAGFLEIIPSLAVIGGALILATLAVILALGAFVSIWRDGLAGFGMALAAFLIGLGIVAYPAISAPRSTLCPRSPTLRPIRSIPRASRRSRACARATPTRSSTRACVPPNCRRPRIPTSFRWSCR